MYTLISIIIILLICFFFVVKQLLELKKEQKLTIEELWKSKEEQYKEEIVELNIKKEEALRYYNTTISQIEKEIREKKEFNQSLLLIREEELDRLIEEKKKEKEQALSYKLLEEERKRTESLNNHFNEFIALQEKEKTKSIEEINLIKEELEDFRLQREAINQAVLREKEIREKEYFYKIDISQDDREDILALREIAPKVKNKEAVNKLVYEVFIRRPLNELIKRVTGSRSISGIYKITYTKTGEAYIGKTTDIQTRWTNHIKTCCGLEGAARTTFHNRLEKDGLWNYTFEILEEVPKDKLGEREKFYIELYGTNTQLNMKKG